MFDHICDFKIVKDREKALSLISGWNKEASELIEQGKLSKGDLANYPLVMKDDEELCVCKCGNYYIRPISNII
jgi:hypothetical protein